MKKRIAIVTGGNRGIGFEICRQLARQGVAVVLTARNAAKGRAACRTLEGQGMPVRFHQLDVADARSVKRLGRFARTTLGRVDILVNNIGGNRRKPFAETTDDDWDTVLELNLKAHIRCSRAAISHLAAAGGGAILFIASIFGREAGGAGLSFGQSGVGGFFGSGAAATGASGSGPPPARAAAASAERPLRCARRRSKRATTPPPTTAAPPPISTSSETHRAFRWASRSEALVQRWSRFRLRRAWRSCSG